MSKSVRPAAAASLADEAPRSNVIPFRARPRPSGHAYYGPADRDPLATPELELHGTALCELAYSIAEAVTGYDATDLSDTAGEMHHERVYAETLDVLIKLTPMLIDGIRRMVPRPTM